MNIIKYILVTILSILFLLLLSDYPLLSLFAGSYLLIYYCIITLKSRSSYLLILFPILQYLVSQSFDGFTFMNMGDAILYRRQILSIFPLYNNDIDLWDYLYKVLVVEKNLKYLQLGAAFSQLLADYNYGSKVTPQIYHITQTFIHLFLTTFLLFLAKRWKVLDNAYLNFFILFSLISPSFIGLVSMLTRHHITFFSVSLYFFSTHAFYLKRTAVRFIFILIACVLLIFSKLALLPFALLSTIIIYILPKFNAEFKRIFYISAFSSYFLFSQLSASLNLYKADLMYDDPSSLNIITQRIGIFAAPYKYIMAILSPFPWYKLHDMIYNTAFGGSFILFGFHIINALFAMHLFITYVVNIKNTALNKSELKFPILFGIIMSLSIIGGSTGFNVYLVIYYPFLFLYYFVNRISIQMIIPFVLVISLNILMFALNQFI